MPFQGLSNDDDLPGRIKIGLEAIKKVEEIITMEEKLMVKILSRSKFRFLF